MSLSSRPFCSAVIPAAGSSSRMGGLNKLLYPLEGTPVLVRTLSVFEACEDVDEIIVVTRNQDIAEISKLCADHNLMKVSHVVSGGKSRTESVLNGVKMADARSEVIAIHDAARPFVTKEIVSDCIAAIRTHRAAAPAVAVKDTIKVSENELVKRTLCRDELRAIQTPQVFERELIQAALHDALENHISITDDCAAVERLGVPVYLTQGSYFNLKITTQEDLVFAKAIMDLGATK